MVKTQHAQNTWPKKKRIIQTFIQLLPTIADSNKTFDQTKYPHLQAITANNW